MGVGKRDFKINVLSPPELDEKFSNEKTTLILRNGTEKPILIKCPVSGNPKPEIRWSELRGKEEEEKEGGCTESMDESVLNPTLVI